MTTKQFVFGLASAIIAVLVAYYLNQRNPDLRYQLSSPIEVNTSVSGRPQTVVQQIEIANTGNAVAQKVQIKITKAVGTVGLTKDSESDKFDQFKLQPEGTELDYDPLRPAGRIKISISGGDPLTERDLEIRDQNGPARSALTGENSAYSLLRAVLYFAVFGFYAFLSGRELRQSLFIHKCRFNSIEAIESKQPTLLSRSQWTEDLVDEAAPHAAKRHSGETDDVASWQIYRLLNYGKPKHLSDDIWAKVLPAVTDAFTSRLTTVAQESEKWHNPQAIRKLLVVPKPTAIFDEKWTELQRNLSARYITALVTRELNYSYTPTTTGLEEIETASELKQSDRDKARDWLRAIYRAMLITQIQNSSSPFTTLKNADLKRLSRADADVLTEFAYQLQLKGIMRGICTPWEADEFLRSRPAFMSDDDYERFTKLAKTIKKADEDVRRYSVLIAKARSLLEGAGVGSTPPPEIMPDEWTDLKKLERELVQQGEAAVLKEKVLRQLEVINAFINDPNVIDRIEEYETTFAPGNLSNLKRLAQKLRASAKVAAEPTT